MSFFHLLQVIIAIIFIYLTLSLLVTEIQEAFASFLEFRAKNLKDSIKNLFGENPRDTETLTDKIYKTNRIKSLNQYTNSWLNLNLFYTDLGPSYIKKEDFSDAVLEHLNKELGDFIANPSNALNSPNLVEVDTIIEKIEEKIDETTDKTIQENLSQEGFKEFVVDKIKKKLNKSNKDWQEFKKEFNEESQKLNKDLEKLKKLNAQLDELNLINPSDPKIGEVQKNINTVTQNININKVTLLLKEVNTLTPLLRIAQSIKLKRDNPQLQDFREELESLFEKVEERTIGVYKRNAKGVSFLIGLILAASLNVDFFYIVDKVARNPQLATSLTENAEEVFDNNISAYQAYQGCGDDKKTDECQQTLRTFEQGVRESIPETNLSEIFGLRNPRNNSEPKVNNGEPKNKNRLMSILVHIPGWIISAIAMAMGAPFWFDLLGKFLNVRNAAKPFEPKPTVPNKEEDTKNQVS